MKKKKTHIKKHSEVWQYELWLHIFSMNQRRHLADGTHAFYAKSTHPMNARKEDQKKTTDSSGKQMNKKRTYNSPSHYELLKVQ